MSDSRPAGIEIRGDVNPEFNRILTDDALAFVAELHRTFNPRRIELLERRQQVQQAIDAGAMPDFPPETAEVRAAEWQVAATPPDLQNRQTEITGPVERRMMINAFNSGADVFMADLEDALAPTWDNVVRGQINLRDAVRRDLTLSTPEGRHYTLGDDIATLLVRPRGWHLTEHHMRVDGEPVAAALFDFGLYFFHNAAASLARGSGPYFYLPKLEHYLEARVWNDVFVYAQDRLGIPRGSVRATVLIETLLAGFCMEEILFELRDHMGGLNAGRWDYIFSAIKKLRNKPDLVLPDRAQITMTVPFMRAYTELLVKTCHARGAHAIGGMAAFIPSRKDPTVNEVAIPAVRNDKLREAGDGFDGSWVAHPDLVPVCAEVFAEKLGAAPNQKSRQRPDVHIAAAELADLRIPDSTITETGVRNNISVALQYIANWFGGLGAVAIFNLMEDAATAEISRSQLWQWIRAGAQLDDGQIVTRGLYQCLRDEELAKLGHLDAAHLGAAREILDELVLSDTFTEFLTVPAYERLVANRAG